MTFSQLLREARRERRMTLEKLAEAVNFHPTHLSLVERGRRKLDDQGVVRVAQVLGLSPAAALLAALRERLPEDLRHFLPAEIDPGDVESLRRAARELQAKHFDFEVEELHASIEVDWEGNLRGVRDYRGCRPNAAGRIVPEIRFRERVVGVAPDGTPAPPKLNVSESPDGLEHELVTTVKDGWVLHCLVFDRGWRRASRREQDTLSFSMGVLQPRAYEWDLARYAERMEADTLLRPFHGYFGFSISHFVHRLRVIVDLPAGYAPPSWEGWAWFGTTPFSSATENLAGKGVSRSLELRSSGGHAELVVDEPLAGYSYAVVWTPMDRPSYLHARYGGPDEPPPHPDPDRPPLPRPPDRGDAGPG